ncbi:hypothetical protein QCA50_015933 [Cerrena zonata]|uniref:Uncharacterized protein n=1 Tax=Cerrena zonata TaxID=2478898 RepID=A0AAW0FQ75_9APHY
MMQLKFHGQILLKNKNQGLYQQSQKLPEKKLGNYNQFQYKKKALSDIQARKLNAPEMPLSKEQKIYLAKKAAEPKKQLQRLSPEIQDFIGEKIANHVNKIDNPYLLAHLDALSNVQIPDFAKTMAKIEESEKLAK